MATSIRLTSDIEKTWFSCLSNRADESLLPTRNCRAYS